MSKNKRQQKGPISGWRLEGVKQWAHGVSLCGKVLDLILKILRKTPHATQNQENYAAAQMYHI